MVLISLLAICAVLLLLTICFLCLYFYKEKVEEDEEVKNKEMYDNMEYYEREYRMGRQEGFEGNEWRDDEKIMGSSMAKEGGMQSSKFMKNSRDGGFGSNRDLIS